MSKQYGAQKQRYNDRFNYAMPTKNKKLQLEKHFTLLLPVGSSCRVYLIFTMYSSISYKQLPSLGHIVAKLKHLFKYFE